MTQLFLALAVVLFVWWRLRRRRVERRLDSPLAGIDTGVRSVYRTPGRFFRPHRGF